MAVLLSVIKEEGDLEDGTDEKEEQSSSVYRQRTWGKANGDGLPDGYSFKGKESFKEALETIKKVMKKGKQYEIGDVKFKALDTRDKGAGHEIDVEVVSSIGRGTALLKLY